MKNAALLTASLLLTIAFLFSNCKKAETLEIAPPVDDYVPTLPDGNRIIIRFGTYSQQGCFSSFSDCIFISWVKDMAMENNRPYISTNLGDQLDAEFGAFFPLTDDFVMTPDPATGASSGPITIAAGIYPVSQTADGRIIYLDQKSPTRPGSAVAPLINPNNPQDNLGNLHNLAMQAILTADNQKEMTALANDEAALTAYISGKTAAFLDEKGIKLQSGEADRIAKTTLADGYENPANWIAKTRLSPNDQKTMANLLEEAASMPVTSIAELDLFVKFMTVRETEIAKSGTLDDAKTVLSAISVMKFSRYYWFWHGLSKGSPASATRPNWWIADVKGLLTGGIGQAITDSLKAILL